MLAAEQYNATTQQLQQKQQAEQQQQQEGGSRRKGQHHKQQPAFADCEWNRIEETVPCLLVVVWWCG